MVLLISAAPEARGADGARLMDRAYFLEPLSPLITPLPYGPSRGTSIAAGQDSWGRGPPEALSWDGWFVQTRAAYYRSYDRRRTQVYQGSFGMGRFIFGSIAIGMEILLTTIDDPLVDTSGIGWSPFLRWHFLRGDGWSVYFEETTGLIYLDEEFPFGGTHFNFTPSGGFGVTWRLGDRFHLLLSGRFYHLSNGGRVTGHDKNPGLDSYGGYVGAEWRY